MVQLKEANEGIFVDDCVVSIPYGSIKSLLDESGKPFTFMFQFLMVQLKAPFANFFYYCQRRFNSLWFN